MHYAEGIIKHFIEKVEKGEEQYAQLSHRGYAEEVLKVLKEKHPETVMVEYKELIFIAFTEEGKEQIRVRLQPKLEEAVRTVERLEKYMELLGNTACEGKRDGADCKSI